MDGVFERLMYWDVHVIQWKQTKRRYKNVLPQACRLRFVWMEYTLSSATESVSTVTESAPV